MKAPNARTDVTLVYGQPHTVQYGHDRDRYDRFEGNDRFERRGATFRHAQWGDFDRDGVVNRFDRAPRNPRRH